jgi:hypothetical protein
MDADVRAVRRQRTGAAAARWVAACAAAVVAACTTQPVLHAQRSAAAACCATGDRAMCSVATPLEIGSPCVCRATDAQGAYVVQGYACTPP